MRHLALLPLILLALPLQAAGLGATKPVASNDTALGCAQNRRVELAKR